MSVSSLGRRHHLRRRSLPTVNRSRRPRTSGWFGRWSSELLVAQALKLQLFWKLMMMPGSTWNSEMVLVLLFIFTFQYDTFLPTMNGLAETLVVELCILVVQETFHVENHVIVLQEMPGTQWFLHPRKKEDVTRCYDRRIRGLRQNLIAQRSSMCDCVLYRMSWDVVVEQKGPIPATHRLDSFP